MRILLTAFEPFDGNRNASLMAAEALRAEPPPGIDLRLEILPVDTVGIEARILALFAAHDPHWWVATGQAGGRNRIALETTAVNLRRFERPDNLGRTVAGEPVVPGGPERLASTLPDLPGLLAVLHAADIPSYLSHDAGTYLCNQVLYLILHHGSRRPRFSGAGFVHLPLTPRQVIEERPEAPCLPVPLTREALGHLCLHLARTPGRPCPS